jgi:AraC family transcriptional activator FtrA
MTRIAKWIGGFLGVLLLLAGVGGIRARALLAREPAPMTATSFLPAPAPVAHDAAKPTVAVLLGADVTEITDMLAPYEMFARTRRYNVYAVAPSDASTTLTGGLRVRPHYSFQGLDRVLGGKAPAIVVAPNVPNIQSPANRSVVEWVRRSADGGATLLSWCAGAAVLAEAGLLDGKAATSHWGDLARLEREYPRVDWRRGTRWIDNGDVVTSAGITAGIDATLRLMLRLDGEDVARRVAEELSYPNFHFALQPHAEQYEPRLSDGVVFLNAAFRSRPQQFGVALYDGVGELDVSSVYDADAAAGVSQVRAIGQSSGLVRTAHGIWLEPALVPQRDAAVLSSLDRVGLPGARAASAGTFVARSIRDAGGPEPELLHAQKPRRFSLEPVLEDLARTADLATATFAQRRLEYRSSSMRLSGPALPWGAIVGLFVLAGLATLLFVAFFTGLRRAPRRETPGRASAH